MQATFKVQTIGLLIVEVRNPSSELCAVPLWANLQNYFGALKSSIDLEHVIEQLTMK
jgi:hypothetical protein